MLKKKIKEFVYLIKSLKKFRLTRVRKRKLIVLGVLAALIIVLIIIAACVSAATNKKPEPQKTAEVAEVAETIPESFQIQNVKVIAQDDLKAGCETYACTMLLNILGFDLDEHTIADNYLNCHYVYKSDDGFAAGPDLYSAFAGTAYAGWGVYAPSMAKSMNQYLADQKSNLKAYPMENVELEDLVEQYVSKGVPVMIWATTNMEEPYVFDTWEVNYVDENAKTKIGDTFSWYMHEHCLVLIGYDKDNYYFGDSTAGKISCFKKDLVKKRYEQLFKQSIVVK
jgi:uncharacterized protein YvpB